MQNTNQEDKIVFFDGICILCNRAVDFLLRKDHKRRFKFASLQSDFANSFLGRYHSLKGDTIFFYDRGNFFTKSQAVLKIAGYLGFPYSAFIAFSIIPSSCRDWIYDIIARNRATWFGRRETCRLPDQETYDRIIG